MNHTASILFQEDLEICKYILWNLLPVYNLGGSLFEQICKDNHIPVQPLHLFLCSLIFPFSARVLKWNSEGFQLLQLFLCTLGILTVIILNYDTSNSMPGSRSYWARVNDCTFNHMVAYKENSLKSHTSLWSSKQGYFMKSCESGALHFKTHVFAISNFFIMRLYFFTHRIAYVFLNFSYSEIEKYAKCWSS